MAGHRTAGHYTALYRTLLNCMILLKLQAVFTPQWWLSRMR
jgi:hypothetical protein